MKRRLIIVSTLLILVVEMVCRFRIFGCERNLYSDITYALGDGWWSRVLRYTTDWPAILTMFTACLVLIVMDFRNDRKGAACRPK